MSERKSIMCGPVELKWSSAGLAEKELQVGTIMLSVTSETRHWHAEYYVGFSTRIFCSRFHDTPEAAAEELARLLGELSSALEPWSKR